LLSIQSKYKCSRAFFRFLTTYILVIVLLVAIGGIIYDRTLSMMKDNAIESGFHAVDSCMNLMDIQIKEIQSIVLQLTKDQKISRYLNNRSSFQPSDMYKIIEISKSLPSNSLLDAIIDDIYIYFGNSDILVSTKYTTVRPEQFYNTFLKYANFDYFQWREKVLGDYHHEKFWPAYKVTENGKTQLIITYVQSIPIGEFGSYKGAVIVKIKEENIRRYLNSLKIIENGWFYITDNQGEIITYINNSSIPIEQIYSKSNEGNAHFENSIDHKDMIIMDTVSNQNGWRYVAGIPKGVLFEQVNYIKNIYLILLVAALILGIMISAIFSYHHSKPLKNLTKRLMLFFNNAVNQKNEIDYIEGSIDWLLHNSESMKEKLTMQLPLLKAGFYERLLRGGFYTIKEVNDALYYIDQKYILGYQAYLFSQATYPNFPDFHIIYQNLT
jgi:two-component system response regulator YesN